MTVTPCVGVWIETCSGVHLTSMSMSHPAWVCGLKQYRVTFWIVEHPSHPAWVCGLKQETLKE